VVSKKELDYNALNKSIASAPGSTYADKVNAALQGKQSRAARYGSVADGRIALQAAGGDAELAATIVAFDKQ